MLLTLILGDPTMNNKFGFSLVEIMVALGLMGVVSLGTMQVMQTTNKTQLSALYTSNAQTSVRDMENILRNNLSCQNTFVGYNLTSLPLEIVKPASVPANGIILKWYRGAPVVRYNKGQIVGSGPGAVKIENAYFIKYDSLNKNIIRSDSVVTERGAVTIEVVFSKVTYSKGNWDNADKGTSFGTDEIKLRLGTDVFLNPSTKVITGCARGENTDELGKEGCDSLGGHIGTDGKCKQARICLNGTCVNAWPSFKHDVCTWRYPLCLAEEFVRGVDTGTPSLRCCTVKLTNQETSI